MKECSRCGRHGPFLKIGYCNLCKHCEREVLQEEQRVRAEEIEKAKAEAKDYINDLSAHISTALEQTVIFPGLGYEAIHRQYVACAYVIDHIDRWREYPYFKDAFKESLIVMLNGMIESPLFPHTIISKYQEPDFENLFGKLRKQIDNVYTACILAEPKAYDYSALFHVAGVTFKNGRRSRQTILRQIRFRDPPYSKTPEFRLVRYLFEGEDAVAVYANDEIVGFIGKYDLPQVLEQWEDYYEVSDYEVIGGGQDRSYGLVIRVCFKYGANKYAPPVEPMPSFDIAEEKITYRIEKPKSKKALSSIGKSPYVVLDVETTGLSPDKESIIELAMLKCMPDGSQEQFVALYNPEKKISPRITKLTGITDKDVSDAPLIGEQIDEIIAFIGDSPLVAHNASFDGGFLKAAIEKSGRNAAFTMYDTLEMSRRAFPDMENHKLETLIACLSLSDSPQVHRAMEDVECTQKLFVLCVKKLLDEREAELAARRATKQ